MILSPIGNSGGAAEAMIPIIGGACGNVVITVTAGLYNQSVTSIMKAPATCVS